ncbi:MAG: ATP-binding protein [Erysipelotrichaceae bacterium]
MKRSESSINIVNRSKIPFKLFMMFWGTLLMMSGIHSGLVVMGNKFEWNELIQVLIPMVYWALVALELTAYTRYQLKKNYEEPMISFAKATSRVAQGDFSVYVPPLHTKDKQDYIDVMFADFNKMVEELGSIETLKTDFFSSVSHEFKTPLAVIQNNAELLKKNIIEEEYIDNILYASKRLSNLITNMLKLNKLEKQVIQAVPVKFDLCKQLSESIIQFEKNWDDKNIDLIVDMEDRVFISSDEELLSLVWTNLLSNAIKFTPVNGKISVTETSDENSISVTICDSGCGMNEETLKHIFDKFYQGDSSHATQGNGLGLSLVHRILVLLDGEIHVDSELDKGSSFTVKLPKGNTK